MPSLFPDEYIYAALGRSLVHAGRPLIRGGSAHFPALLEPVLTAPVWLVHDVDVAYRLLQVENALAISLAAIPVYLIARRLRLGAWMSLALAALAVVGPQTLFASGVLAEPFSYPLLLASIAAAMALLEQPTRRRGIVFVVLALLSALARVQLAIVPACTLVAAVAMGVRERRLRRTLREQRLLVGLVGAELALAAALAATHHVGYYEQLLPSGVAAAGALRITGAGIYVVLLTAGCALAPGAVAGWALALLKPRTRGELAFAALATALAAAVLLQCALYGDLHLVQERYLMYLVPLVAICFALRATRRPRRWLVEAALGAVLVITTGAVPLSGYAHSSKASLAPFLFGIDRLEIVVRNPGSASLIVATAATVLVGLAVAGAARPHAGTALVLALSLAFSLAGLAGGFSFDRLADSRIRDVFLPHDRSWVDHERVGPVTYLAATGAARNPAHATMFWNPSIDRLLLLPGTARFDKLPQAQATVAEDGTLQVHGKDVRRAVLADEPQATVRLRGARRMASFGSQTLWLPQGPVRLASLMIGRAPGGPLVNDGTLYLWPGTPRAAGWLELRVTVSPDLHARGGLRLRRPHGVRIALLVRSGRSRSFRVPVCTDGSWRAPFTVVPRGLGGVSVGVPRFVPDPGACNA
jgi:hypothetical protein